MVGGVRYFFRGIGDWGLGIGIAWLMLMAYGLRFSIRVGGHAVLGGVRVLGIEIRGLRFCLAWEWDCFAYLAWECFGRGLKDLGR